MADYKVTIDLDSLTIGDLELLEKQRGSLNIAGLLAVLEHVVRLDGVAEKGQAQALRALPWTALNEIAQAIADAVEAQVNQEAGGKNSKGG